MKRHRLASTHGFSLIELLVVVSVIAVLAAISMPVMSKMLAKSRMVGCQNNLRQIGVALNLYLADNDNVFPGPLTGAQPVKYKDTMSNAMAMHLAPYLGLPVDGTMRVNEYFLCPVYAGQADSVRTYGISTRECDYPFGYSNPATGGRQPMRLQALTKKREGEETWLLKDIYRTSNGNKVAAPEPAHGEIANFLMLDGSVQIHPVDYTVE